MRPSTLICVESSASFPFSVLEIVSSSSDRAVFTAFDVSSIPGRVSVDDVAFANPEKIFLS